MNDDQTCGLGVVAWVMWLALCAAVGGTVGIGVAWLIFHRR